MTFSNQSHKAQTTIDKNLKAHIEPIIIQNIFIIQNFYAQTMRLHYNPFVQYLKNLQTYHLLCFVNCIYLYIKDSNTYTNDGLRDVLTSHDSKRNDLLYKQEKSQNMFPS